jgi:hypothetical protein
MQNNLFKALVRSLTPWLISGIVYMAVHLGYKISMTSATEVAALVGTLLTLLAHILETKYRWFGVFLGWLGAPSYTVAPTKAQTIAQLQAQIAALEATLLPGETQTVQPAPVVVTSPLPAPTPAATVGVTPPPVTSTTPGL